MARFLVILLAVGVCAISVILPFLIAAFIISNTPVSGVNG